MIVPFGFGPPDRDPEQRGEGGSAATPRVGDPFGLGALFGGIAGGGSPEDLLGKMPLFAELQKLMSWSGGPVNWDLARQGAISQLAAGHQPTSARRADRGRRGAAAGRPVAGPGHRAALGHRARPRPGPGSTGWSRPCPPGRR